METVTYTVRVYRTFTWATGRPMRTGMQEFKIEAEATILGGCSAITQAVEACNGLDLCDLHSPDIEPNPAKLGWPLGA